MTTDAKRYLLIMIDIFSAEAYLQNITSPGKETTASKSRQEFALCRTCNLTAISLHSHHVSLVQWTTRLLPVTREPGSTPLGGLVLNRESPVIVDSLLGRYVDIDRLSFLSYHWIFSGLQPQIVKNVDFKIKNPVMHDGIFCRFLQIY